MDGSIRKHFFRQPFVIDLLVRTIYSATLLVSTSCDKCVCVHGALTISCETIPLAPYFVHRGKLCSVTPKSGIGRAVQSNCGINEIGLVRCLALDRSLGWHEHPKLPRTACSPTQACACCLYTGATPPTPHKIVVLPGDDNSFSLVIFNSHSSHWNEKGNNLPFLQGAALSAGHVCFRPRDASHP